MKITFLGTGTSQGVPVIACNCEVCQSTNHKDKRLRTSILVEDNGNHFIIDSGPDFRQQVLRENLNSLDAIIFTHQHKDHTAGLDDVRAFNFIQKKDMSIYGTAPVIEHLKIEFYYAFATVRYPGVPQLDVNEISNKPFQVNQTIFNPIQVMHHKLPVFGYRIHDFTYITDANYIEEEEKKKIKGSKILVLNALRKEEHLSHFTLDQALALIEEIQPEQAYLTHLSHQMGLHKEVSKTLPENVSIAYDQLQIEI